MKQITRMELSRAFKNRSFYFALMVGIGLAMWHFIRYGVPLIQNILDVYNHTVDTAVYFEKVKYAIPVTQMWLGTSNAGTEIYFFVMPLLSAIPYGASYCIDVNSGYVSNIVTRVGKKDYYRAKLLAVFLSGGAVCVIPLVFELLLCMCFAPVMFPLSGTHLFAVQSASWLSGLFYSSGTWVYIFVYLLFDFLALGLISSFCLIITWVEENRFAVMLAPFIVCFAVHILCSWLMGKTTWSPLVYTFFPQLYTENLLAVTLELLILAVLAIRFTLGKKDEGI